VDRNNTDRKAVARTYVEGCWMTEIPREVSVQFPGILAEGCAKLPLELSEDVLKVLVSIANVFIPLFIYARIIYEKGFKPPSKGYGVHTSPP
jgi:hypothetical protein